jgi:6-phosphogluconolactonase/glucosamine-6-phosphate isomerase/deaminase
MKTLLGHEQKLLVTLTDERYGPVSHADSNWQQLLEAGFYSGQAAVYPVLQDGLSLAATAQAFNKTLQDSFNQADVVIGQLGIGADGHTSGILPRSPAVQPAKALAIGYKTAQFDRISTTFTALKRLEYAYVFAYGQDKQPALQALKEKNLPLADQPAQILKLVQRAYVYNDQVEGEA